MGIRHHDRLRALVDVGMLLAGGLDLATILPEVVRAARDLTGARYGALGVLDESGTRLSDFVTLGVDDDVRRSIGDLPTGRGILGALITDPRPLRLADIADDPRSVGFPPHHPPMGTFLGVPIISGGDVFGNLYLTDKADGEFTEDDEQAAVMLAAQAGIAIRNARLFADVQAHATALERALDGVSAIDELLGALLTGGSQDEVLALLVRQVARSIACTVAGIAVPSADLSTLRYTAAAGANGDRLRGHEVPVAGSKAGAALLARRTVRVDDLESDPDAYAPTARAAGVRSLLIVPLVRRYEAVGVLVVGGEDGGDRFTAHDERLLEAYATRAVLVLEFGRTLTTERARADALGKLVASEVREAGRKETLKRVVEAQERERRRLALELHDETGQSLAAVLMGLRRVEESDDVVTVRRIAAELRETVVDAVRELRALAVELRPKALDDFGLAAALERLAETFATRTGITVDAHLGDLDDRLPEPIETACYRIAQEALTNVAKHSGASTVSLVTRRAGGSLIMVIEDNGKGFDPDVRADGLGLVSMRERAELLGGGVSAESSPGGGTTLVTELPVA